MDAQLPYRSAWDFLQDELRRLDLLLGQRIRQARRRRPEDPLEAFRGLVVSDEEVADLVDHLATERAAQGEPPDQAPAPAAGSPPGPDPRAALEALDRRVAARLSATGDGAAGLPLLHLAHLFRLTPFEGQCLVLALAPELDRRYERVYGYLEDDVTQKRPSVSLAMDLFCDGADERFAARLSFDPQAPLMKHRLLRLGEDAAAPLLSRPLGMDDRVASFLLGRQRVDARLDGWARLVPPPAAPPPVIDAGMERRMRELVGAHDSGPLCFHLHGPPSASPRALVESVCAGLGVPLMVADLERVIAGALPLPDAIWLLAREAALLPAALCVDGFDALSADPARAALHLPPLLEALRLCSRLTFLVGRRPWIPDAAADGPPVFGVELRAPEVAERKKAWVDLGSAWPGVAGDVDWGSLAGRFRFGVEQIRHALQAASHVARWRGAEDGRITTADLDEACRITGTRRMGALARKLATRQRWEDLVLPPGARGQLQDLCNEARHRHQVLGDWGFDAKLPLGRGLSALFTGAPGTGKTMAASVIAADLGLDLYRVDLSQVVSKYIGETEKNLGQVFDDAEATHAILYFDEADALFGKRSEVRDAHDRYANVEVGYLLQRMEEFDGTAILATNLRQNLDEAFARRMRFVVEFPVPDEEQRRRLWQVTFPSHAPLSPDLDFDFLAREVRLSGGHIRNIGLASAFYAAADGGRIQMEHLLRATRREYEKLG
ncbi:MAG TPA: ATP-binding protein [Myxococcales bacterium]|nr:ATP-binding protein [Myxococcales bacterium]